MVFVCLMYTAVCFYFNHNKICFTTFRISEEIVREVFYFDLVLIFMSFERENVLRLFLLYFCFYLGYYYPNFNQIFTLYTQLVNE